MHGERVMFPQKPQLRMGGSAPTHIIFGMDLEKAERLRRGGYSGEMLGLKARAGAPWKLRNAHGFFSLTRLRARLPGTQKGARGCRAPPSQFKTFWVLANPCRSGSSSFRTFPSGRISKLRD